MTGDPSVSVPQPNPSGEPRPADLLDARHDDPDPTGPLADFGPVVPSARVDLDEIEADFADPGVVGLRKLGTVGTGPLCRLVAAIPALVAEVRRLREDRERWVEKWDAAWADAQQLRGERDAARAEAERLRERIDGQAETISKLGQVAAEAGRVMEALQAHGPSIVGHLLDTDDNAGERLRELLREVSEWALNGTTASTPLRAEIERLRVEAGRVREALQARFDFEAHLARQREFSDRTFGPGLRTEGVTDHIRKELKEIEDAPTDLGEWIDVVILGLDDAGRTGATPKQIIAALTAKQERNERRAWPDWRTAPPDKAIEHVRALDAALDGAE